MKCVSRVVLTVLLAVGLVLGATPAWAETEQGIGIVRSKDLTASTVTMDTGRVYKVTSETRIVDASGAPMTLADVPAAKQIVSGLYQVAPMSTFRFQAQVVGGDPILTVLEQSKEALE